MIKLISFDIKADFGMLKKPDTNEPVYLTFNMLHKPALLGILGAIAGLKGFQRNGELPEYYEKLKNVQVGIMPLPKSENSDKSYHENGNFTKTIISYTNTSGYANEGDTIKRNGKSIKPGDTLMVAEQTLVTPAFRCFALLDETIEVQEKLIDNLLSYQSEFVPYLGKNDCSLWWENAKELDFSEFNPEGSFKIDSLFVKEEPVKDSKTDEDLFDILMDSTKGNTFSYFENLPVSYLKKPLFQYEFRNFAFSDWDLKFKRKTSLRYIQLKTGKHEVIQLY